MESDVVSHQHGLTSSHDTLLDTVNIYQASPLSILGTNSNNNHLFNFTHLSETEVYGDIPTHGGSYHEDSSLQAEES